MHNVSGSLIGSKMNISGLKLSYLQLNADLQVTKFICRKAVNSVLLQTIIKELNDYSNRTS
jgi:hypothetical protein